MICQFFSFFFLYYDYNSFHKRKLLVIIGNISFLLWVGGLLVAVSFFIINLREFFFLPAEKISTHVINITRISDRTRKTDKSYVERLSIDIKKWRFYDVVVVFLLQCCFCVFSHVLFLLLYSILVSNAYQYVHPLFHRSVKRERTISLFLNAYARQQAPLVIHVLIKNQWVYHLKIFGLKVNYYSFYRDSIMQFIHFCLFTIICGYSLVMSAPVNQSKT